MKTLILILLLIIFVVIIVSLLKRLKAPKEKTVQERLQLYIDGALVNQLALKEREEEELAKKKESTEKFKAFSRATGLLDRLSILKKREEEIKLKIAKAGLPMKPSEFMGLKIFSLVLGMFVGALLGRFIFSHPLFFTALGSCIGYFYPNINLWRRHKKRVKAFNDQLVDALSLMSNSLKAGYSFLQAVQTVGSESVSPMKEEFQRVIREDSLGVPIEKSLTGLAVRMESDDFDLIVTAVLIQRQIGGNLAEILDSIADTIRQRIRIKGQIRTLTAQGKMSGLIITALPFAIFFIMYLMQPDIMSMLFKKKLGWAMIVAALISQAIGAFWINKVVSIEV
ncbi:type II secretion system F family protein [bacterium]|nr:type II secretion system F family protein [bacterium]MBU1615668.1 type II secretion system F family protein [bacterium]